MRELSEQEIGAIAGGTPLLAATGPLLVSAINPLTVTFGTPLDHWFYQQMLFNGQSDAS